MFYPAMISNDTTESEHRFCLFFNRIDRIGQGELFEYLTQNGYFESPSSSQYHGSHEGGNLEHSLNVTELMLKLRPVIAPNITEESCIICGLFHDLGKAGYYGKPNYVENLLKSGKRSDSKPYTTNPDRLPIPHQVVSLHILSKFIPLTEDEVLAILYHNGLYTPDGYAIKGKETQLMMLLHFCDMWASRVLEKEEGNKVDGGLF